MTTVTRAADAPRAASVISSSSIRCSCTGGTSGWIRNTSRSLQLACSCTPRQSLANRSSRTGCSGTCSEAQISRASRGWALPLNTMMSRTRRSRGLPLTGCLHGVERRQRQPVADGLLDDLGLGPRVHRDHELLAPEHLQHGIGLVVVLAQPDRQRLLGVVLALDELAAARVALARHVRAVLDEVVVHAAA